MTMLTVPRQIDVEQAKQIYQQGAKDFAEWLISRSMLCDSLGQDISDCYDGDNNKAIEDVLDEWQSNRKNESRD